MTTMSGSDEFDSLYRTHYADLWRFATRLSGSEQIAEDVVQSVFLSVWTRWKDWSPKTSAREYLFRAVRNEVYKLIEHDKVVKSGESAVIEAITNVEIPRPDKDLTESEVDSIMRGAVDALPLRQKEAFLLRWNDNMNPSEIGRVMEISPTAATNLLTKAQDRLKEVATKLLDRL